ncbi:MAG TPA: YdeI/OmpD-associated family protein [Vicinamibacterales bacterium]|nr:YdeI/OmpD-associated family protein [Vicinamibacterales bacterium]
MPTDPRVDAYIAKARPFAQPILRRIRAAVHAGCPGVAETIKWSVPAFDYKGPLAGMAAFKAHCVFGFWKGALMKSVPEGKEGQAKGRFGRFESVADLPGETALVRMVKEAAALADAGVKAPRQTRAPKPPPRAPAYVLAAIRKNKQALRHYQAFSPSCRREYIEWITEAKTGETRARRLATAVEWMSEGKSRNWKYTAGARRR